MTTSDTIYSVIGVIGSLITAFAILPLIFRVVSRQSSAEISYAYQIFFVIGIAMFLLYYGYYDLWAAFFPTLLSLVFMLSLLGMKIHLEGPQCQRQAVADGSEDSTALGIDIGRGPDFRAERRGSARSFSGASSRDAHPAMSSW